MTPDARETERYANAKTKSDPFVRPTVTECAENGCEREGAVRLRIPWAADEVVCTAHARVVAQQDGVVAEPLEGADWP